MQHKHITILCDHNITTKPRSSRMLKLLSNIKQRSKSQKLHLYVVSKDCSILDFKRLNTEAMLFSFPADKTSKERNNRENEDIYTYCKNAQFEKLIFTENRESIFGFLHSLALQDMLIVEDITLLPFALTYKNKHKRCIILIDLREFYPLEYENDALWLGGLGRFFTYLCEHYLPQVDIALSVSKGLCKRYKSDFNLTCTLFYSLPSFHAIRPTPTQAEQIKILYHGFISPDRSSMELLSLAKKLINTPYKLYAMVLSNQKGFLESFGLQVQSLPSIELVEPVSMEDIIQKSAQYDIGLIPFKPTTFNLAHCMPNKFFEYIQSRLALVCTPLYDIRQFIKKYQCGLLTQGFESDDMANALYSLSTKEIDFYKAQADKQAKKWHMLYNLKILENLLQTHLGIKIEMI